MSKRNKIIYWIATLWLSLGMVSTGIVQLLNVEKETQFIVNMGFPVYILTLLGLWKILGVIVVLIPRWPLLKEWAYAGFFFTMSGAVYSHIFLRHSFGEIFPPFFLLALTVLSWYLRPSDRKVVASL